MSLSFVRKVVGDLTPRHARGEAGTFPSPLETRLYSVVHAPEWHTVLLL